MSGDARARDRRTFALRTAEGTLLPFERAAFADRFTALFVDQLMIQLLSVLLFLFALIVTSGSRNSSPLALFLVANFIIRNAWFTFHEIRSGGSTPGKRMLKLRVVSRNGGSLEPEQLIARNLTREFELYLPLLLMMAPGALFPDLPAWAGLMGSLWLLAGALFPLLNPERMRLGDLLGGTVVVHLPRPALLHDLAAKPVEPRAAAARESHTHAFTAEQLDQYGIEQLDALADVLRRIEAPERPALLLEVARRVERKIGHDHPTPEPEVEAFLRAFYVQLRARLEHKAQFGVRQEGKRAGYLRRRVSGPAIEPPRVEAPPAGDPPADDPPATD